MSGNISMVTAFKYTLDMSLLVGNKSYQIPKNSIKTIIINSDYDKTQCQ